ncbi:MAG TPA: glycosyltransferase, partial [Candidatus Sulfotelmatobacter sp.]|nr:glycosyltransferase [Candidatus Sulfotelmatobacter sp.]
MSPSPPLSVVMAAYNAERYLEHALESILGQSFGDLELIVIDDGSTDGTSGILERTSRRDERLHIVHQPNRGVIAALNRGCGLARGRYIARMDADDIALSDRFARQIAFLESHPVVAVLGTAVDLINDKGVPIRRARFPLHDRQIKQVLSAGANCISHPAVMMRKDAFVAVGGYRPPFLHAEEYDLWLRTAEYYALANLPEVLLHYRIHANQLSARYVRQQVWSALAAQAAARIRRRTGQEPPLAGDRVTESCLAGLAVGREQVRRELIARYLDLARLTLEAGDHTCTERLLSEALAVSRAKVVRQQAVSARVARARSQYGE